MKTPTNVILAKQEELKLIADIYGFIVEKRNSSPFVEYKRVGKKSEQAKDWRTGELLWEDDEKTVPRYDDEWAYLPVPEDEWTEGDCARAEAIERVLKKLENLV